MRPSPACAPERIAKRNMIAATGPLKLLADNDFAGLSTCGSTARPLVGTKIPPSCKFSTIVVTRVSRSMMNICSNRGKRKEAGFRGARRPVPRRSAGQPGRHSRKRENTGEPHELDHI